LKISNKTKRSGFTLVEMMMSMGCGSFILTAVIIAGVALQRSFAAVEGYSIAEGDQLRVLDYIAMDCRRAIKGQAGALATPAVDNGSWVSGSWVSNPSGPLALLLTLPVYYDASNSNQPFTPTLSSNNVSYATGSVTIIYSQSGSNFNREVVVKNSAGTTTSDTTTAIATNVSSFTVTSTDLTSSVSCYITFSPRFVYLPGPGPIYGTTVYCNTFLRNAGARQ
jgi:Tfp pilus assembly protein PilW